MALGDGARVRGRVVFSRWERASESGSESERAREKDLPPPLLLLPSKITPQQNSGGMLRDADASIAVTVEGYRYSTAANAMRTRVFSVMRDVRRDHGFCSIVTSPSDSPDLKPRVNWAAFHETVKLSGGEEGGGGYGSGGGGGGGGGAAMKGVSFVQPPVAAPAPPAPAPSAAPPPPPPSAPAPPSSQQQQQAAARISINLHRNSMDVLRSDAAREAAAGAGGGGGASAAAAVAAAAAAAAAPSAAAASPPSARPLPSAVTPSFTAAAAAAAAATAEATRAPPPEAGGGMLLPPGLDPDSTFRLRSAAAQGARARLDESLFEVPEAAAETRTSSLPRRRRSDGGDDAV